MESEQNLVRAVRLAHIPHYLNCHPQGLTAKELASLFGVSVRTIERDLNSLQSDLKIPVTEENNRYGIMGDYILPPVSFSLYEAVALFLASRLAIRHIDEYNPHVADALYKMSGVLPHHLAHEVKRSANTLKNKRKNPELICIFETIAIAWTTQRQVSMQYQSLQSRETKRWLLEPYFIEMSGAGDASYVIGHAVREGKEGIITFKLERIKKIELTGNNFKIPPDFDIEKQLASSWGVIWGDGIEVELKFSADVTRRVKESVWHESQVITDLPDGGCLMKLHIGSLLEITPWIRSWGPDVEVLAPLDLRDSFAGWARRLQTIYCPSEK